MRGTVNTWSKEGIDSFIGVISSVIVMCLNERVGESTLMWLKLRAGEGEQQAVNLEMALRGMTVRVKELDGEWRVFWLTVMWVPREMHRMVQDTCRLSGVSC